MSNFNNGGTPNQRKKTLLTDYRLPHPSTDGPMPGGKYDAQLMFDQKNNGEITMKVSDGVFGQGNGKTNHKEVVMDYMHRGIFFEAILEACSDANFTQKSIAVRWKQFVFQGGSGRMSDAPILQCNLIVGRSQDGGIFIGYTRGDYKAQFRFKGPKDTVVFVKGADGNRTEDHGVMSRWAARAWVRFHSAQTDALDMANWQGPKPKNAGGNGGNGGGGNNWNNNGNGNGGGGNNNWNNNAGGSNGGGNGGGNSPAPASTSAADFDFDDNIDF